MMTVRAIYEPLHGALAALRDSLRVNGFQHLACMVPVMAVRTDEDFLLVQTKLHAIKTLMALRPPPAAAYHRVSASLDRVVTLVSVIEKVTRRER